MDGLIEQWGNGQLSSSIDRVNFAVSFTTSTYGLAVSQGAAIDSTCNATSYIVDIQPAYFGIYGIRGNNDAQIASANNYYYYAIGY